MSVLPSVPITMSGTDASLALGPAIGSACTTLGTVVVVPLDRTASISVETTDGGTAGTLPDADSSNCVKSTRVSSIHSDAKLTLVPDSYVNRVAACK